MEENIFFIKSQIMFHFSQHGITGMFKLEVPFLIVSRSKLHNFNLRMNLSEQETFFINFELFY